MRKYDLEHDCWSAEEESFVAEVLVLCERVWLIVKLDRLFWIVKYVKLEVQMGNY